MDRPITYTIDIVALRGRSDVKDGLFFDDVASTTGKPFRATLRIQDPCDPLSQLEKSELIQAARKVLKLVIGAGFSRDEVHGMTFTVRPV
jgi:hypothetical protein